MDALNIGSVYSGFKLLEERKIKEINSIGRLFEHVKSGAQLFHLENDDENKVFSISFRTPPSDSTGLPHILEHAVLCGSKKFPLKDPFIELAKGSLNTYLNAMTFSDKTMYPVASQNDKDFMNLMDVYLDAVFNPNIYEGEESFLQEGWHYELNHPEDPIRVKGVVYNEMKGAFSSPEQILFSKIQESLFPDTAYRFESGGDPEVMTNLTYDQFIDFHRNYYHPSNSYIYLYGNGNLKDHLKFLDEEYLSKFNKIQVDSNIDIQPPFQEGKEIREFYSISMEEKEENKTFISKNYVLGESTDPEKVLAFTILNYILLGTPAAPLKRALIEAGIGKDVFGYFDSSIRQPVFSIVVKNSQSEDKERFSNVLRDTLINIVDKGIDKTLIEAAINIHEFKLREADYGHKPKGLVYNIKCMNSWLYGKEPWLHLEYEGSLEKIKTALKTDYFEVLIKEYILDNPHNSLVILEPKKGLENEREAQELLKLDKYKEQLSEEKITELIHINRNLQEYQSRVETEEALLSIPILSREDIKKEVEPIVLNKVLEKDVEVLLNPEHTNGIAYINLFFDTRSVPEELIPYTALLAQILGKVSTKKYNYNELSNLININTGGIYSKIETYSSKYSDEDYLPKYALRSSTLIKNLPKLFELLIELANNTRLDEADRIKEIIGEIKSRLEMNIFDQGHIMAARRVNSYFSPMGSYVEKIYGISYYMFIAELDRKFDDNKDEILGNLARIFNLIFNRTNLLVSITAEATDFEAIKKELAYFIDHLPKGQLEKYRYFFRPYHENEGLLTPGKVQYVAKGYNFRKQGYEYSGSMQVLKTIISLGYLWNKVRVAGGAYGALANFSKNGNMVFSSYRDPNLRETLEVYDQMDQYIKSFKAEEREMQKYIIGTISNLDTPLSPFMKGDRATVNYITGVTLEELQKEREEVLNTRVEDIRKYAPMIKEAMDQNYLCVLGNEDKIGENKDLFNTFTRIFN